MILSDMGMISYDFLDPWKRWKAWQKSPPWMRRSSRWFLICPAVPSCTRHLPAASQAVFHRGLEQRAVAAHAMNAESSRSHVLFTVGPPGRARVNFFGLVKWSKHVKTCQNMSKLQDPTCPCICIHIDVELWYVFNIDHPLLALPNSFNPTGVSRDSTFWALLEVYVTRELEEGEGQVVSKLQPGSHECHWSHRDYHIYHLGLSENVGLIFPMK